MQIRVDVFPASTNGAIYGGALLSLRPCDLGILKRYNSEALLDIVGLALLLSWV